MIKLTLKGTARRRVYFFSQSCLTLCIGVQDVRLGGGGQKGDGQAVLLLVLVVLEPSLKRLR